MATGKIRSYSREKGFAFIRPDEGGDDVFLHRSAVAGDFDAMGEGQTVEFELDRSADRPRAKRAVPQGSPPPFTDRPARANSRQPAGQRRAPMEGRRDQRPRTGGSRFADARSGGSRGPGSRPGGSRDAGSGDRRSRDGRSRDRRDSRVPRPPAELCVKGFVTKMRYDEEPHGYISADSGWHEIRFEPQVVTGEASFRQLRIGDYVEFVVVAETKGTREPIASYVYRIERPNTTPSLQLGRHPKARKKKPSWR
jgi:cold shock CspA family protein